MRQIVFAAAICAIAAMGFAEVSAAAGVQDATGTYTRQENGGAILVVTKIHAQWKVKAVIGGIPNDTATVADCSFIAEGTITGGAFEG